MWLRGGISGALHPGDEHAVAVRLPGPDPDLPRRRPAGQRMRLWSQLKIRSRAEESGNHRLGLCLRQGAYGINQAAAGPHFIGAGQQELFLNDSPLGNVAFRGAPAGIGIARPRADARTRRINQDAVKALARYGIPGPVPGTTFNYVPAPALGAFPQCVQTT